jgi:hypothetical protein
VPAARRAKCGNPINSPRQFSAAIFLGNLLESRSVQPWFCSVSSAVPAGVHVTDLCGFFLVLSIATAMLSRMESA